MVPPWTFSKHLFVSLLDPTNKAGQSERVAGRSILFSRYRAFNWRNKGGRWWRTADQGRTIEQFRLEYVSKRLSGRTNKSVSNQKRDSGATGVKRFTTGLISVITRRLSTHPDWAGWIHNLRLLLLCCLIDLQLTLGLELLFLCDLNHVNCSYLSPSMSYWCLSIWFFVSLSCAFTCLTMMWVVYLENRGRVECVCSLISGNGNSPILEIQTPRFRVLYTN